MRAGNLRHRITFQRPVKSRDAMGAEILSWTHVGHSSAEVLDIGGREFFSNREDKSEIIVKITIRYRADIGVEWRVIHGARTYNIEHLTNLQGRNHTLELRCSEVI